MYQLAGLCMLEPLVCVCIMLEVLTSIDIRCPHLCRCEFCSLLSRSGFTYRLNHPDINHVHSINSHTHLDI